MVENDELLKILGYFAVFICPAESEIVMLERLIDRKTESHKSPFIYTRCFISEISSF
ncbi:hypothetical protein AALP_AAs56226U000100 [Arabis alpina]|uniref:Uncharacterized protein n=1 Tax=Arabis alpina TaxID=50452 RepID=A0A087FYG8_ARAAL|nr:hypothetical protein AALP_AAs56226U000100 [Arabis alpina]